jgi:hypothetical protein
MGTVPLVDIGRSRVQRTSAAVSREIAGETIVVPICSGVGDMEAVYSFNGLGGELWRLLERERSPQELVDWVAENFEVTPEAASTDVASFLADLLEVGLVQTVEAEGQ